MKYTIINFLWIQIKWTNILKKFKKNQYYFKNNLKNFILEILQEI